MRKNSFIGTLTLAALALGVSQPGTAAWEESVEAGALESGVLLRVQQRTGPRETFSGRPEFPPPGYLAEFEEPFGQQRQRETGDATRSPPAGSRATPPAGRAPEPPEFAPRTLRGEFPGSREGQGTLPRPAPGATRDGREPPGGRPTWAQPPAADPRSLPQYGEMPGTVPGARPDRDHFPATEPRRRAPSAPAAGSFEHQWPSAPSLGSSYQTQPEFRPETWDRGRPGSGSERFGGSPEFPGSSFEWQR
ncbi:hypothetical protein [Thioalkalivibrio sp.]|uniref:hypothetical protein n=1 Tax=Thioalkalivibrio sp. TaxID=2093813 RepID=UPI0012D5E81E|nr:hypothetical protein [Thioalkalivibrio sp.]TVP80034.1 MAG: hypothetical protein EA346_08325 [Thioalkalivibrio sp.]